MRAVVISQPGPLAAAVVAEIEEPSAGPGEVIVEIMACDVNYPDILYIEGRYQKTPRYPFSPGLGGAGVVCSVGAGVNNGILGTRVLVLPEYGTYAEKVRVPIDRCFAIPDGMPFETAAALGLVYQTAYFALTDHARIVKGDKILVLGATGGIGMAAMQLAKALGAGKVIAATRGEPDQDFFSMLGADHVVNTDMKNVRDDLRTQIYQATGDLGVDIVIDPVGGPLSEASLRTLAWRGRIVVVGFASGEAPRFAGNYLLIKNISASGIQWTDYIDRKPAHVAAAQDHIFHLWSEGHINPRITNIVPLEEFATALSCIAAGRHHGKTIVTMQMKEGGEIAST